jgi:hypothetical protein
VNREQRAADIATAFGAAPRQTTRYQELLAMTDVDAVLIATPDMTDPHILAHAVGAGKDVYVEKPFAVHFADAKMAWQAPSAAAVRSSSASALTLVRSRRQRGSWKFIAISTRVTLPMTPLWSALAEAKRCL